MTKNLLRTLLILALLMPILSFTAHAQGGDIATPAGQFPIVKQPITFKVLVANGEQISDFNKNAYTQWLEQKTGVTLQIDVVNRTDEQAKLNLVLASGDLPDILLGFGPQSSLIAQQGAQVAFLPLNDLMSKYADAT